MKSFNLEEYLRDPSKKIITRDGRKARIICTNRLGKSYPVCALIINSYSDEEYFYTYTIDGERFSHKESNEDLFFFPEKKEGWINIYVHNWLDGKIYPSKEEALSMRDDDMKYITTAKIEWEE